MSKDKEIEEQQEPKQEPELKQGADREPEQQEQEKIEIDDTDTEDIQEEATSSFSAFKVVLITLSVLILIGVSIVGIGGYYVYSNLQPVDPNSEELIQVEIPMGTSPTRIAAILKENNVIKHEQLFYYYVRYTGASGFQAGEYYISPSSELDDIIEQLKEGRLFVDVERFTVPEGLSVVQVAEHLEQNGMVDKDRFLQVINEGDFSHFDFIQEIPESEHREYRLEGFLFPETYEIFTGASEEDIINVMLKQFEKEMKEEWQEALEEFNLTFYELVTLASIIEREAVVNSERPIISGVFHNRMREGWMLQSCATVQFVLGKQREVLLFEDLEVESPYNTYINEGLPPGPIASPGRLSLEAALFPDEHEYFFFVTKKDNTGEHHFARTYQEHLANDAQSRGNF